MEILWLAIIFYSIGLGLVLHFKPDLMFNEDGTWKEFGYQRSPGRTMFPFWLFAISWAFVSYAVAAAIYWVYPALGLAAMATTTYSFGSTPDYESASEEESDSEEEVTPVSKVEKRGRGRPRKSEKAEKTDTKPREGYYVVDPESEKGGLRKYVYFGSNPPPEA